MSNKKITTIFILIATFALLGIVGFTIAYFTSSTDFENVFNTGLFQTTATETFVSPTNWKPGDTEPKTLTITNTGNVNVKARVCIDEEWKSDNGDILPNKQKGQSAAIINFANTDDWTYRLSCYEYNDTLEPGDSTSSFVDSVTFNPIIKTDLTCEYITENKKRCTSSGDGYDKARYKLTFTVETIQADAYGSIWKNPYQFVNRQNENAITTGDELAIGSEHFYVVSSDSNETVLLAKYNLLVGNILDYDDDTGYITFEKTLSSSDTGYGLQNSEAKGWIELEQNEMTARFIGVVGFSGTNYWDNSVCEYVETEDYCTGDEGLLPEYSQRGEIYYSRPSPYVFRSDIGNSIAPNIVFHPTEGWGALQNNGYAISYFVENYINKLKELGAISTISGRLLSVEEAENLGCASGWCSNEDWYGYETDATAPDWVYSSSYWLGSAFSSQFIYNIYISGNYFNDGFLNSTYLGVRPVIVIPTLDIE